MLESFHRVARRWKFLSPVAAILAAAFLLSTIAFVLLPHSQETDFFLIPSVVGFIWALSAYVFLTGFREIPRKATRDDKLLVRIRLGLSRTAYSAIAVVFLALTAVFSILSLRMAGIWFQTYL